jgi:hypothetical protein
VNTSDKILTKENPNFNNILDELAVRFKGKGGGPESESAVTANKEDIKDGYVWFYSCNSDVSKLINRSRKYILEVRDSGDYVSMKMNSDGFRGTVYSFKVSKN